MALSAPQIERLGRELAKASSTPDTPSTTLLRMLDEINKGVGAKATEDLLRSTKIGVIVNKLKGNKDGSVAKAAGDLVTSWRNQVKAASKKSTSGAAPTNSAAEVKESNGGTPVTGAKAASPAVPAAINGTKAVPLEQRTWKTDEVNTVVTDNDVRNRCLQLMYDGLANMSDAASDLILQLAIRIETAAFTLDPPTTSTEAASEAYRAKIRSLFQNLKNKSNPMLRQRVIGGEITPERFVRLTADELKSPERLEEEKKIEKENMNNAMVAQVEKSVSSSLTCGKCHEKKVSYTQAQTRSADEPMTTFCECTVCGNRWKFC